MLNEQLYDLGERAAWTFAQAFLASFAIERIDTFQGAALAGVAAVLALLKGYVAIKVKPGTGAATL
jgi:hypothetical protein